MRNSDIGFLTTLESIIQARLQSPIEGSYTSELVAGGRQRIAQKVGEEAIELALAAASGNREATMNEAADLLYHVLVMLNEQAIELADIVATLEQRHAA